MKKDDADLTMRRRRMAVSHCDIASVSIAGQAHPAILLISSGRLSVTSKKNFSPLIMALRAIGETFKVAVVRRQAPLFLPPIEIGPRKDHSLIPRSRRKAHGCGPLGQARSNSLLQMELICISAIVGLSWGYPRLRTLRQIIPSPKQLKINKFYIVNKLASYFLTSV